MRKSFVGLAVLAISALSTGVAAPAGMAGTSAAKPLRMTVGALGSIGSLDPRRGDSVIAREVWNLQYPTLTALDPTSLEPTTGLAFAWSPLRGGHGWRYSLRANQAWSDGRPVTAADVVYSLDQARTRHWPDAGPMVESLTAHAVNARTVDVTSTRAARTSPELLLHIVPAHIYSSVADVDTDVKALGVGDGAWHVVSRSGDSVELGVLGRPAGPALDQIVYRTYPSADSLIAALSNREVDVISGAPDTDAGRLDTMQNVTVVHAGDGTRYVLRSESRLATRLRRVVSLAIDRAQLVADAVNGVGTPDPIAARPGLAKRDVLALDAGHEEPTVVISTDPTSRRVGALLRSDLAAVGLDIRLVGVPPNARVTARTDFLLDRVSATGQPTNTIGLFQPDTLQAFRTDNVSGFLREPSHRALVVFGPTIAQYADIVAATKPQGEQLSNLAYAVGAAVLLALCAAAYWIASRLRQRYAT